MGGLSKEFFDTQTIHYTAQLEKNFRSRFQGHEGLLAASTFALASPHRLSTLALQIRVYVFVIPSNSKTRSIETWPRHGKLSHYLLNLYREGKAEAKLFISPLRALLKMSGITAAVAAFVTSLESISSQGRQYIDALLAPLFAAELELRSLFVLEPNHPSLLDPFVGLIDVFSTPLLARRTWPRTQVGVLIGYQSDPLARTGFPLHYLLPLHPNMRRPAGSCCIVDYLSTFRSNFEIFTDGAFSRMHSWENVVVAGGAVLACLTAPRTPIEALEHFFQSDAYRGSDVDVFLFGLTPKQAKKRMLQIYEDVCAALPSQVVCIRKANTITIHSKGASHRQLLALIWIAYWPTRPIQFVLRLYRSPAEILAGFDVDSSCCLFDGEKVWLNPRALASLIRQCNTVDMTRRSPSYEVRLAKYADRGFEVYYPLLKRERIDYAKLYDRNRSTYPLGLARLIVLERIRSSPFHYYHLYKVRRTSRPQGGHRSLNFQPIDRLLANNYDFSWVKIPYGRDWTPERIKRLVIRIDDKMNSPFNTHRDPSRRLHRHAASYGDMKKCLYSSCCFGCPRPETEAEQELVASEKLIFIRGCAEFVTIQPGRQLVTGSFRPASLADWSAEAYLSPDNSDVGEHDPSLDEENFIYLQREKNFH